MQSAYGGPQPGRALVNEFGGHGCIGFVHKQSPKIPLNPEISVWHHLQSLRPWQLNNTRKSDIDILFFNRCAKVGSESMVQVIARLESENNITLDRLGLRKPTERTLKPKEQNRLADYIFRLNADAVYVEHVGWIDFHKFGLPKPIYINLVRDPVERVISWFYYARNSFKAAKQFRRNRDEKMKPAYWYKKDFTECVRSGDPECQYVPYTVVDFMGNYKRQSLFYCGHSPDCLPFDSPVAIKKAMRNVEKEYAVVGTWEEANITLTVLEHYIPKFFKGALAAYEKDKRTISNQNRNNRKPYISPDVKEMIRRNFTNEYEFYYFCRQRLFKQYIALQQYLKI